MLILEKLEPALLLYCKSEFTESSGLVIDCCIGLHFVVMVEIYKDLFTDLKEM